MLEPFLNQKSIVVTWHRLKVNYCVFVITSLCIITCVHIREPLCCTWVKAHCVVMPKVVHIGCRFPPESKGKSALSKIFNVTNSHSLPK